MAAQEQPAAASSSLAQPQAKVVPLPSAQNGWVKLPTSILSDPRLDSGCRSVLIGVLSYDWEKHGRGCTASARNIALRAGISRATFFRHFSNLEQLGYIIVHRSKTASGELNPSIVRVAGWVRTGKLPKGQRDAIIADGPLGPHRGAAIRRQPGRETTPNDERGDRETTQPVEMSSRETTQPYAGPDCETTPTTTQDETGPAHRETAPGLRVRHKAVQQRKPIKQQALQSAAADEDRDMRGMLRSIGIDDVVADLVAAHRSLDEVAAALEKAGKPSILDPAGFVLHLLGYRGSGALVEVARDVTELAAKLAKERHAAQDLTTAAERKAHEEAVKEAAVHRAAQRIADMAEPERGALAARARAELEVTVKLPFLRQSAAFETMIQVRMRDIVMRQLEEGA